MSSALEQLFLPAECLLCHSLLSDRECSQLVCGICRGRWRPVRPPWCPRCGQPAPHFGPCRLCAGWPAALRTVRSAVWLREESQRAVHALKYGGFRRIADDLATAMGALRPCGDGSSVLIPIPLAPKRLRARGYNQSEALARALARHWRVPVVSGLLVRSRETPTQTALTPETRLANVRGVFKTNVECPTPNAQFRNSTLDMGYSTFVLVDDVFTTGATLAEAARALEQAGAREVHGITFARAAIPDFT